MRFFDEDNNLFEKTMVVFLLIVSLYVGAYIYLRRASTSFQEVDGCPPQGCEVVNFPRGGTYLFFKPLVHLDEGVTCVKFEFY